MTYRHASHICRWSVALLLAVFSFSAQAGALRFEAEDGTLLGKAVVDNKNPGFSGHGYVTALNHAGDAVEIPVNVSAAGFYILKIGYSAHDPKRLSVLVNHSMQGERLFPATTGFRGMTFGRIALQAGQNTVRIEAGWGWVDIDYIEIAPAPQPLPFQIADHPVNPEASAEAKSLFALLKNTFGKKVFAGQQDERGLRCAYLSGVTAGKAPAIRGFDMLNYSGAYNRPDDQIEAARDWALKQNGIVEFSWHWFSPFGATGEVWSSFSTNKTTFDASRILDEQSAEYAAVVHDIDLVADHLKTLRDAHVPVLWRPLHEAEGKWFWWGAKGPEIEKNLYHLMYDRFTKIHHLNNLLWVWTTTDDPDALDWYPGDDCVDIVGADLYAPEGVNGTFLSVFDNLRQLYRGKKMIALCETGAVPDPDAMAAGSASWLWFLVWDDYIERKTTNPPAFLSRVFSNQRVITLDTLPAPKKAR